MRSPTITALASLLIVCFLLAGCGNKKPDFTVKVLIGGTTITSDSDAPIEDSVIVIAGSKIRSVGPRKDVPVPQASDRTDLTGEWVVPAPGSRIEAGETANMLILKHAPNGIAPAAPGDMGAQLVAGEWKMPGK
ncbi:MAG TPA: hypothetical protein VGL82_07230 [Bryobacteraceae bacterium]|jgi:hypothetical protein